MPKSSTATRTPCDRSVLRWLIACSVTLPESTSTPSVISRIRASGGRPDERSTSSTIIPKSGSRNCRGDTFTETTVPCRRCQPAATRHDSRSTLSSAAPMKRSGGTIRSPAGCHLISASTPVTRSSASRISGW